MDKLKDLKDKVVNHPIVTKVTGKPQQLSKIKAYNDKLTQIKNKKNTTNIKSIKNKKNEKDLK